jgi:hypothetical protein
MVRLEKEIFNMDTSICLEGGPLDGQTRYVEDVEPILHFLLRDWQVVPYLADPVTDPPNPHKQHWAVYERTDRTVERDGTPAILNLEIRSFSVTLANAQKLPTTSTKSDL